MRARLILPAVAMGVLLASCQAPAAAPAGLTDEDTALIRANTDTYIQHTLAGDFAGVAALFTDGAIVLPPNEAAVSGRAAIQTYLENYPTITTFEAPVVDVTGTGDMAVARGTYRITATVEGMADPINDTGKWMIVNQRQADGSWLATAQIWNSDLPIPTPGT